MVAIIVKKDAGGRYCGFSSSGHAGYAEKGDDVVCAAISTLTLTAVLALEKLTALKPKVRQNEKAALLECNWTNEPTQVERSDLIIRMMLLGLGEIRKQYSKYLMVGEVEG